MKIAAAGYAEYLLVPDSRHLLPLLELDPISAAPLTDTGHPFPGGEKIATRAVPGSTVVIIGAGGLGQFGVQYARTLTPSCRVIAVDINHSKLAIAKTLGPDEVFNSEKNDVVTSINALRGGEGAQGVVDFVGSIATMKQAQDVAGRQAKVVIVGLAGGQVPFTAALLNEVELSTSSWGSQNELSEGLELARQKKVSARVQRVRFEEVNTVLEDLKHGRVEGRAVLAPSR